MKVVRTHNSKISTYIFKTNNLIFAGRLWILFRDDSSLRLGSQIEWGGAEASLRLGHVAAAQILILLIFCPHNHTNTENIGHLLLIFGVFWDFFLCIKMRLYQLPRLHSSTGELELGYRHTPHGVVHTCCLCLMLRLKGVIQPRLISPSCYSRRLKVTAPSNHRPERVQNLFISNFHPMHEKF